eukprot:6198777-Pleurochrysis_carterae.AAC.3
MKQAQNAQRAGLPRIGAKRCASKAGHLYHASDGQDDGRKGSDAEKDVAHNQQRLLQRHEGELFPLRSPRRQAARCVREFCTVRRKWHTAAGGAVPGSAACTEASATACMTAGERRRRRGRGCALRACAPPQPPKIEGALGLACEMDSSSS